MRKLLIILGLVLLLQLIWASASYAAPPASGGFWHTVRYGETLFSIGRRYDVNPYAICRANQLYNCNYIRYGQRLWIPHQAGPPPYYGVKPWQSGCAAYHTVAPGQTLYGIGRMYRVAPWAIAQTNHLYNWNIIYAGQTLCIPNW